MPTPRALSRPPETAKTVEWALFYAKEYNWAVFPVQKDKTPYPRTHGFKDAVKNPYQIHQLFSKYPDANIACATGAVSGIWVLDSDCKRGKVGEDSIEEMEKQYGKLPDTLMSITWSKGVHRFFKMTRPVSSVAATFEKFGFKDIDTRGDGGYVVLPPSKYDGKDGQGSYDWEVTSIDHGIVEAPDWIYDLMGGAKLKEKIDLNQPVAEGARRDLLFRYGCSLRAQGFDFDLLYSALSAVNEIRCDPPLSDADVQYQAKDICERYKKGKEKDSKRVDITVSEPINIRTSKCCAVLSELSSFYRSPTGAVVRISDKGLERVNKHMMAVELTRYLRFIKYLKVDKKFVERDPPMDTAMQVLSSKELSLRNIEIITTVPRYLENGTLSTTEGYNPSDRSYYLKRFDIPDVPFSEAQGIVNEFLSDFAWADYGKGKDHAHALSLLFAPALKGIIDNFPLHAVSAVQERTGKSLLVDCITAVYGHVGSLDWPKNQEEMAKKLTASLIAGPMFVVFDNVKSKIEHSALEMCLTTGVYMDRILGRSEMARVPSQAIFVVTGNHLSFGAEMMKRTIVTELNAHMAEPEKRTGFKHPDLKAWVTQNRERLLGAVYSIISEWFSRGQPRSKAVFGGFEKYASIVGGILEMMDCKGFLEVPVESARDVESEFADSFLTMWHEMIGEPIPHRSDLLTDTAYPKDLVHVAEQVDFDFKSEQFHRKAIALGYYLKKLAGKRIKKLCVSRGSRTRYGATYKLVNSDDITISDIEE